MSDDLLTQIRRIPREQLDLVDLTDPVYAQTFVEAEQYLRRALAAMSEQMRAARPTDRRELAVTLAEQDFADEFHLLGAYLYTYFASAERAARIGAERAERMITESRAFGTNSVRARAPWLYREDAGDS